MISVTKKRAGLAVEVGGRFGQQLPDALQHTVHAKLMQGTDWDDFSLGQDRMPQFHFPRKLFLCTSTLPRRRVGTKAVNLVDEHQYGSLLPPHLLQEIGILVGSLHHVGDIEQDVGILQSAFAELQHLLLQLIVRLQHTRRVAEANLHLRRIEDAHDAVARGLRLESSNGNAFPHKEVHERGLPYIRVAHDVDKTGLEH